MNISHLKNKIKDLLVASSTESASLEFEIFLERDQNLELEVKDQQLDTFESAETIGLGLRLLQKGKMAFAYSSSLEDQALKACLESALQSLPYAAVNKDLSFAEQSPLALIDLKTFAQDFDISSSEPYLKKALMLEKSALDYHSSIKHVRGASASATDTEIWLFNSLGLERYHRKTLNMLSLMAVAEEGDEAESAYEFGFSNSLSKIDAESIGKLSAKKAQAYLGAKAGSNYSGAVLLDSSVVSDLIDVLAPSFYADNVYKTQSMLRDHLDQKIFSPLLTLMDNPHFQSGVGSCLFDAEGETTRPLNLIEQGKVVQWLSNREYKSKMNLEHAGNSMRESYKRLPSLHYSNLILKEGDLSFKDLLQKLGRGIYLTELIGIHTANAITGDFSVGAQGFWVEEGEIQYALKQIAVAGNIKKLLSQVKAVGNDLRFYYRLGVPSLLLEHLDVAGS